MQRPAKLSLNYASLGVTSFPLDHGGSAHRSNGRQGMHRHGAACTSIRTHCYAWIIRRQASRMVAPLRQRLPKCANSSH